MEENKVDEVQKKPVSKKKTILQMILVIIFSVLGIVIVFLSNGFFQNFDAVIETFKKFQGVDLGYAFVCLFLYALFWPISLCILARLKKLPTSIMEDYLIGSTEHFFNGITPFATGGQPLQIFLYTKKGVKASESTGMIVMNFIAFLIATNIFSIISLFFYRYFAENFNSSTSWIVILGFTMNFFTLAFMIVIATCKWVRELFSKILNRLKNIKFLRKPLEKGIPVFDEYCYNAQEAAKQVFAHPWWLVICVFIRLIDLCFYYAIPFFSLRALGVQVDGIKMFILMGLATSFAITSTVWVPTPGGSGGIEFAFTTIFTASIFALESSALAASGMLIWRGLTYYVLMFISFTEYLILKLIHKKKGKKGENITND